MNDLIAVPERPIIYSAPMVNAILEDRKTKTRRLFKGTTEFSGPYNQDYLEAHRKSDGWSKICPYGNIGDRLWVKENYSFKEFWEASGVDDWGATIKYLADDGTRLIHQCDAPEDVGFWPGAKIRQYEGKNRPSIFMYRWTARILLEITDIRVEQLQEISEEDAKAEGAKWYGVSDLLPNGELREGESRAYRAGFHNIWQSIHGIDSWNSNPWIWVITFKVLDKVNGRVL